MTKQPNPLAAAVADAGRRLEANKTAMSAPFVRLTAALNTALGSTSR